MNNMNKIIKELIPYIIIVIAVVLIRSYIITPVIVRGNSMDETLHDGEVLILDKLAYQLSEIKRFDIVVVKDKDDDYIIKRIIGLPGDKVEYKHNNLYINDEKVITNFTDDETEDFTLKDICNINNDNCKNGIPKDKYLVLGDNRDISADSRIKGLIDKSQITGKTTIRLWPLSKINLIK